MVGSEVGADALEAYPNDLESTAHRKVQDGGVGNRGHVALPVVATRRPDVAVAQLQSPGRRARSKKEKEKRKKELLSRTRAIQRDARRTSSHSPVTHSNNFLPGNEEPRALLTYAHAPVAGGLQRRVATSATGRIKLGCRGGSGRLDTGLFQRADMPTATKELELSPMGQPPFVANVPLPPFSKSTCEVLAPRVSRTCLINYRIH
jgi:hypothetical protein